MKPKRIRQELSAEQRMAWMMMHEDRTGAQEQDIARLQYQYAEEGIRRDNASIQGKHKANNEERRDLRGFTPRAPVTQQGK